MINNRIRICLMMLGLSLVIKATFAQSSLKNWPEQASPNVVGQRIADRFLQKPYLIFGKTIGYPEVCTWYGALNFAKLTNNTILQTKLVDRFTPLLKEQAAIVPVHDNVDHSVFGVVPLQLYIQTGKPDYLPTGKLYADKQWLVPADLKANPELDSYIKKGFSWQTRLWIDDMFMITMLQIQAYRATNDKKYLDRAAAETVFYLDTLQRESGLFYHAPDVPFFWGRGNGWMAAGMSELLLTLPKDHPTRPRILKGYQTMMAALLKYQAPTGMWRQLVNDDASWPEASCTGMFTYGLITGVKNKWLDEKTYGPAARKGWLALVNCINADADVIDVCVGTNKKNDHQYYLDRGKATGDLHGQAPVLWCVNALLR